MIKHMFKLVWNRKRTNALIAVEVFFSFLVLFAAVTLGLYFATLYGYPLGFSYRHVWGIWAFPGSGFIAESAKEERAETLQQIFLALQDLDGVVSVAGVGEGVLPYGISGSSTTIQYGDRKMEVDTGGVTDTFGELMGLEVVRGRWFEEADDALNWRPVVINQELSKELFGQEDPLGKAVQKDRRRRVVGVVSYFRRDGELSGLKPFMLQRARFTSQPGHFLIRVRPSVTAAFEEKLTTRLRSIARDWIFEVDTLSANRETSFKLRLVPLIAAGTVAVFLMLMVGLGLMGVLWQNVTRRTQEIGLRRANGATVKKIHTQVLGELLAITTIGLAVGTAVVVQFPLLDVIGFLSGEVYVYGLAISLSIMYLLTVLCGLYPSWLATKVQPAEALHYE